MTRKIILALAVAASLVLTGCGSTAGNPLVMTEGQMATELHKGFTDAEDGGTVTDATCIKKTDTTFTCMGTWTPSIESLKDQMPGYDPSAFDMTWEDLVKPENASWTVTVSSDGAWIAAPN